MNEDCSPPTSVAGSPSATCRRLGMCSVMRCAGPPSAARIARRSLSSLSIRAAGNDGPARAYRGHDRDPGQPGGSILDTIGHLPGAGVQRKALGKPRLWTLWTVWTPEG